MTDFLSAFALDLYTLLRLLIVLAGFVSFGVHILYLKRRWGRFDFRYYLRGLCAVASLAAALLYGYLALVGGVVPYGPYITNPILLTFIMVAIGQAALDAHA